MHDKHMTIRAIWITGIAFQSVPGLPAPCGGHAPSLSGAEQQVVTSSQPQGWFSNSRTLQAAFEGIAGAAINTTGKGAAEKEQREDLTGEVNIIRIYTVWKNKNIYCIQRDTAQH